MSNQAKASALAKAGFDLWQAGRLEDAVPLYREAIECADQNHYAVDAYHSEFAAVLATLGRDDEAREQYERALPAVQRIDGEGQTPGGLIARYFLSEHLLKMNAPAEALAILERAMAAFAAASSEEKATEIREDLAFIINAPAGE